MFGIVGCLIGAGGVYSEATDAPAFSWFTLILSVLLLLLGLFLIARCVLMRRAGRPWFR